MSIPSTYASTESDTARNQVKEIIKGKKYRDSKAPLADDAQRISRWLGAQEEKPKRPTTETTSPPVNIRPQRKQYKPPAAPSALGPVLKIILIIFAILIASGIIYVIALEIIKRKSKSKKEPKKKSNDTISGNEDIDWIDEEKVLEEISDAQVLEDLAIQAHNAGHNDIALRYLFRAGLLRLDDNGIISFHPSITNTQWQLILNNNLFNGLTKEFNDITYGKQACMATQFVQAQLTWTDVLNTANTKERPQ